MMLSPRPDYVIDRSHPDPDRWKLRWGLVFALAAAVGLIVLVLS